MENDSNALAFMRFMEEKQRKYEEAKLCAEYQRGIVEKLTAQLSPMYRCRPSLTSESRARGMAGCFAGCDSGQPR